MILSSEDLIAKVSLLKPCDFELKFQLVRYVVETEDRTSGTRGTKDHSNDIKAHCIEHSSCVACQHWCSTAAHHPSLVLWHRLQ